MTMTADEKCTRCRCSTCAPGQPVSAVAHLRPPASPEVVKTEERMAKAYAARDRQFADFERVVRYCRALVAASDPYATPTRGEKRALADAEEAVKAARARLDELGEAALAASLRYREACEANIRANIAAW